MVFCLKTLHRNNIMTSEEIIINKLNLNDTMSKFQGCKYSSHR